MLLDPKTRKYISDHLGTFIVAGVMIVGPLLGTYAYVLSHLESLGEERVALERDKAAATIDIERKRLEVEKLQAQLSLAVEGAKQVMEQARQKEQQVSADNQRIQDDWSKIQLWRQKLSPEQEYRQLVDEFTRLSVDFNHCVGEEDRDRHIRARLLAKRIWYAAAQTNSAESMAFAKSIQPMSLMFGCPAQGR